MDPIVRWGKPSMGEAEKSFQSSQCREGLLGVKCLFILYYISFTCFFIFNFLYVYIGCLSLVLSMTDMLMAGVFYVRDAVHLAKSIHCSLFFLKINIFGHIMPVCLSVSPGLGPAG